MRAALFTEVGAPVEVVHDVPAAVMQGRVVVPTRAGAPAPSAPAPAEPSPRQVEGFRVQVARDGAQALDYLRRRGP